MQSDVKLDLQNLSYASFGDRFMAFLIDSFIQALLLAPLIWLLLRADFQAAAGDPFALAQQVSESFSTPQGYLINYGFPLLYFVLFWKYKSATPGKLLLDMAIIDATTGGTPAAGRLILRYVGYYVNILTCFIGFIWIAFDKRGQGLHDKMANTLVVMVPPKRPDAQRVGL
jgi:uncharacterized RDD family membrane protein YckC